MAKEIKDSGPTRYFNVGDKVRGCWRMGIGPIRFGEGVVEQVYSASVHVKILQGPSEHVGWVYSCDPGDLEHLKGD